MENNPYILSIRSLGSLYYLFLTTIGEEKYCIYIDKKVKRRSHSSENVSCQLSF